MHEVRQQIAELSDADYRNEVRAKANGVIPVEHAINKVIANVKAQKLFTNSMPASQYADSYRRNGGWE